MGEDPCRGRDMATGQANEVIRHLRTAVLLADGTLFQNCRDRRVSMVWSRRPGGWVAVFSQETVLRGGSKALPDCKITRSVTRRCRGLGP